MPPSYRAIPGAGRARTGLG